MNPPVYLGIVIRHVTPATSRVRSLGDPIEDHLLYGHPCGECSQQISIIEEEMVLPSLEDLSDGQLDAVMPSIGGVELPADGLEEVTRGLFV